MAGLGFQGRLYGASFYFHQANPTPNFLSVSFPVGPDTGSIRGPGAFELFFTLLAAGESSGGPLAAIYAPSGIGRVNPITFSAL